ncbi:TVP38/TMEM64 family protein [Corynebacterium camporealensis]|uniref:TVP38/TMEM64 family protein n=1 Tax=Corynebacterium camporealensis TaxID=161896 RepID=UPI0034CD2524
MHSLKTALQGFADFLRSLASSAWATMRGWSVARWCLTIAAIVAVVGLLIWVDIPDLNLLGEWAERLGPWFIVGFIVCYVIFTQFPLPRTVWTVAAGVLFGPWLGLGVALVSLTISAALSLTIVRWLLGDWIRPHLAHPAVFKINAHLERRGWLAVGSLRMVAGVPFSILNYVAALTPIPFAHFVVATTIGSIPTTALGVFFGDALAGEPHPALIAAIVFFAALGLVGLYLDSKVPTRVQSRKKGRLD